MITEAEPPPKPALSQFANGARSLRERPEWERRHLALSRLLSLVLLALPPVTTDHTTIRSRSREDRVVAPGHERLLERWAIHVCACAIYRH